mmetsp:Transcript_7265/g.17705  ORF Transcript_7265/g.17705 Transcript_7265/m.17705 type:complete len:215 (+) Transcript_7265:3741-4385(+)
MESIIANRRALCGSTISLFNCCDFASFSSSFDSFSSLESFSSFPSRCICFFLLSSFCRSPAGTSIGVFSASFANSVNFVPSPSTTGMFSMTRRRFWRQSSFTARHAASITPSKLGHSRRFGGFEIERYRMELERTITSCIIFSAPMPPVPLFGAFFFLGCGGGLGEPHMQHSLSIAGLRKVQMAQFHPSSSSGSSSFSSSPEFAASNSAGAFTS